MDFYLHFVEKTVTNQCPFTRWRFLFEVFPLQSTNALMFPSPRGSLQYTFLNPSEICVDSSPFASAHILPINAIAMVSSFNNNDSKKCFSIQPIDRPILRHTSWYMYNQSPFKHILVKSYSCVSVVKEQGILCVCVFVCDLMDVHKLCERWMSNNVLQKEFLVSSTFFLLVFIIMILFSFFLWLISWKRNERRLFMAKWLSNWKVFCLTKV